MNTLTKKAQVWANEGKGVALDFAVKFFVIQDLDLDSSSDYLAWQKDGCVMIILTETQFVAT